MKLQVKPLQDCLFRDRTLVTRDKRGRIACVAKIRADADGGKVYKNCVCDEGCPLDEGPIVIEKV